MTLRSPYQQSRQHSNNGSQRPRTNADPMSIDARQAATQRGPYDYLKPRPRYDGVVQSTNYPQGRSATARAVNPRVVNVIDTTVTPVADAAPPRGFLRNAWPAFQDVSAKELEQRGQGLLDALERDGLHFQALTVGEHEGKPMFLLYLDRALRANELVPTEHDGIRVQRMTVGKFKG